MPLVTTDPYFSIWSFADRLTDDVTRHWTGKPQSLESMIRIDGAVYRLMGRPVDEEALPQVGLAVFPTRTIYEFEGAGIHVTLTFLTPLLPNNLDVLSRPVTYLIWEARAVDGRAHAVSIYYANTAQIAVNTEDEAVTWSRDKVGDLTVLRMGSQAQPILAKSDDDLRIDWGYFYAAAPMSEVTASAIANPDSLHDAFLKTGGLPNNDAASAPLSARRAPQMAFVFDMGQVQAEPVARHLILAYDDLYSIEYFHQRLRPYWRRNGVQAADLLNSAEHDYDSLRRESENFDRELMTDLTRVGGEKYARVAALAYRQSLAAHKLVAAPDGQTPYYFPQGEFQLRLHLHRGRDLSRGAGAVALESPAGGSIARADNGLRQGREVAVRLGPARFGRLPACQRARPPENRIDAGGGIGQHANPLRRDRQGRGHSGVRGKVRAHSEIVGGLPGAKWI